MGRKAMKPNPQGLKGNTRMRDLGRVSITIWFSPGEKTTIERAAKQQGGKTATWIREIALEAAGGLFPPKYRD